MKLLHGTRPGELRSLVLIGMLCATFTSQLGAQSAQPAHVAPVGFGYDKTHEITVNGTVQNVSSERREGGPFGLHLLVTGSQGTVDAHLGPYLTEDMQESFHAGAPVQIVGAMETIHGKSFLLARQVISGGRIILVRNANGFLVRGHGARAGRSQSGIKAEKISPAEVNGDAR